MMPTGTACNSGDVCRAWMNGRTGQGLEVAGFRAHCGVQLIALGGPTCGVLPRGQRTKCWTLLRVARQTFRITRGKDL